MLHVRLVRCLKLSMLLLTATSLGLAVAGCGQGGSDLPTPTWTVHVVVVTATFTPTPPPTPTSIPTPTATPIPLPTATSTPLPTDTSIPSPTITNTPRPTRTPTPSPTPTLPPYNYVLDGGPFHEVNNATTTIKGFVYDAGGNGLKGVGVRLSSDGWSDVAYTGQGADPPGYYSWGLRDYSMDGTWRICVVDANGNCDSPEITFQTFRETLQSVVTVNWRRTY